MQQLSDVYCWIKVVDNNGKVVPQGAWISTRQATVRYVVANDSHLPAGPLTVVGSLYRDGVKVQPGGQPNVVPAQQITVQPGQLWQKEFPISEFHISPGSAIQYEAKLLGDVGGFVKEEDETNNLAKTNFNLYEPPH
jgi:hypothetical protein